MRNPAITYTTADAQRLERLSTRACQLLLGHGAQLTLFDRPRPAFWREWAAELAEIAREIELVFNDPDTA